MSATFEHGILSPVPHYLQDGGAQPAPLGTPRPGTPRGNPFRLSPEGNLGNPGTPGGGVHDLHKLPNSPWSGSEPSTPGYSRSMSVVPSSPHLPSYPNTPATPGSSFYQKGAPGPASYGCVNGTTTTTVPVPPGSPWTERSVCTPGPMTPMTPATPMHSNGEHNGLHGGNSPPFPELGLPPTSTMTTNSRQLGSSSSLSDLLQDLADPTPPSVVPVMGQQEAPTAMPPLNHSLPPTSFISDSERSQAVELNPNLISEFEDFLAKYITDRKNQDSCGGGNQQQQQPAGGPSSHPTMMQPHFTNGNHHGPEVGGLYSGMSMEGGHGMMNGNGNHLVSSVGSGSGGPMRGLYQQPNHRFQAHHPGKNHPHPHHQYHPYMVNNGGRMVRAGRPLPMHMGMQSNGPPSSMMGNLPQQPPHHMMNNLPGSMHPPLPDPYAHQRGGNVMNSPSVMSNAPLPPPSNTTSGGYMQQQPVNQPQQHSANNPFPNLNGGGSHWAPSPSHPPPPPSTLNNHPNGMNGMNGMMSGGGNTDGRGVGTQGPLPSYFQNQMGPPTLGNQAMGGGNEMPPVANDTSNYSFDVNQVAVGGNSSNNGGSNVGGLGSTSSGGGGGGAMQNMSTVPAAPGLVLPSPSEANIDLDGPYDGSNLTQATWAKAADKASKGNPVAEAGKVLFDEIFTDDEVIHCTLSGRGSTQKFNPNKVLFLKKAVAWLKTAPPPPPYEFNLATCDASLTQEEESGVRGIEKKVFTEYRSRRRGDILKTRGPVPPP